MVVGYEYQAVCHRHGGDGDIGVGKRLALLAPSAEQIASELRDFPSHRVELEAAQEFLRLGSFARAHTHVNLGDVHGATGDKNILMRKLFKELRATVPII